MEDAEHGAFGEREIADEVLEVLVWPEHRDDREAALEAPLDTHQLPLRQSTPRDRLIAVMDDLGLAGRAYELEALLELLHLGAFPCGEVDLLRPLGRAPVDGLEDDEAEERRSHESIGEEILEPFHGFLLFV